MIYSPADVEKFKTRISLLEKTAADLAKFKDLARSSLGGSLNSGEEVGVSPDICRQIPRASTGHEWRRRCMAPVLVTQLGDYMLVESPCSYRINYYVVYKH